MQNLQKKYLIHLREKVIAIKHFIYSYCLFILYWINDTILIFKNLRQDTDKYNLHFLSILYNALIKYPLLGFRPAEFFMYRLYKNSYNEYVTFFESVIKLIRVNNHMPYLLDDKMYFSSYLHKKNNEIKTPNLIAHFDHRNKKITHYAEPTTDKVVIKPIKGYGGKGVKVVSSDKFVEELKKCNRSYIAEDFIEQHSFLNKIFSESVNTIRIITVKNNGDAVPAVAAFRVGRTSTDQIDNSSKGGITISIDMESGMLKGGHTYYKHGHTEYSYH